MTPGQRLQELGLVLPAVTPPRGNFVHHTEVVNGCSDLLVEVFGERGRPSAWVPPSRPSWHSRTKPMQMHDIPFAD